MTMTVACCGADGTLTRRVLGLSHDHVWPNLTALATGDLGQPVAVAEPDARLHARLERLQWRGHGHGPLLYDSYLGVIGDPQGDHDHELIEEIERPADAA